MARGRRGNGEGGIYKDKERGRWIGQYTDGNGKRRSLYAETREQARVLLNRAISERDRGMGVANGTATVADYLRSWLDIIRPTIRESTWIRYRQLCEGHLIPALGRHKLAKLTPYHVQSFYAAKLASGTVSATTVRRTHEVLRNALGAAVRREMVARNVATLVDAPRPNDTEMRVLSPEQLVAFLAAASDPGERLGALYTLAVTTGMRAGELLALRWRDVDLTCSTVQVRASLTRTLNGYVIGKPKTKKSERKLTLPEVAWDALREHRARQLEERMRCGPAWHDNDMVFASERGTALDPANLRHRYAWFLRRHELPDIRFHDLRHTAATTLLGEHEDIKRISAMLGHSKTGVTADIYLHVSEGMQASVAETMNRVIRRATQRGEGDAPHGRKQPS